MKHESKQEQYAGYLRNGGTMTLKQWENDGRYDWHLAGEKKKPFDDAPIPDATILSDLDMSGEPMMFPAYFNFHTTLPNCETVEQMKCLLKIRFQHHLDQYFENYGRGK